MQENRIIENCSQLHDYWSSRLEVTCNETDGARKFRRWRYYRVQTDLTPLGRPKSTYSTRLAGLYPALRNPYAVASGTAICSAVILHASAGPRVITARRKCRKWQPQDHVNRWHFQCSETVTMRKIIQHLLLRSDQSPSPVAYAPLSGKYVIFWEKEMEGSRS